LVAIVTQTSHKFVQHVPNIPLHNANSFRTGPVVIVERFMISIFGWQIIDQLLGSFYQVWLNFNAHAISGFASYRRL
jgi:hypothetical protein